MLATFTYDSTGVLVSVQVDSDPNSSPRYYYVYNGHGDVVALVDAQGNVAASYSYDAFGLSHRSVRALAAVRLGPTPTATMAAMACATTARRASIG